MSTLDETRFRACRTASDICTNGFHKHGKEFTVELCKGTIEGMAGALQALEGETAAYYFVQQLADNIANKLIEYEP